MIWPVWNRLELAMDPFEEFHRLHRQAVDLFGRTQGRAPGYPALNLSSNEQEALVSVAVPGVEQKSLSLTVTGDVLTIEGERVAEAIGDKSMYHRRERGTGSFSRSVRLPFPVDAEKVSARHELGILTITLPRKESSKPRKIAITAD